MDDIDIEFIAPCLYWLTDRCGGDIYLGWCDSESELREAVATAVREGGPDANWRGWSAQ